MKLKKIDIVNFRSIEDITIISEPMCQGLVGINESGKTNILTAISLLSDEIALDKNDVRIEGLDEGRNQNAYIEYYFELSNDEMDGIVNDLMASIYHEKPLSKISLSNKKMQITDFFSKKNTGLYYCNINNETRTARYYQLNKNEIISLPELKKKISKTTSTSITSKSGENISLAKYDFIETSCIESSNAGLFDNCTTNDLNVAFGSFLTEYVKSNLPQVVYWKYDDKYLLPSSIVLEEFKDDPDSCIPLKSMFVLAGYENIDNILSEALTKRANVLTNILKKVSQKSSEYLHKVWHDYKNVSFELRANGLNIDIHIQDTDNFYNCGQRSDGFKRFVTFLLALSARVNNGEIKDSIIVIDEPDLGIHILGQKNLVQELIKISKNNMVFYSTHSIFMIDKKEPSRHFIVRKRNEITTIERATESNYTDDEVLFNALGYSIFEALKPNNIIFEGWSDKKVYDLAVSTKRGKQVGSLTDVGRVHSTGVKNIISIAKDLELANRGYAVISDSDKPAKDKRKEYIEKEKCVGEWYLYENFTPGIHTLEDYICHSSYKKSIELVRKNYTDLTSFDYTTFSTQQYQRETYIKNWIKSHVSDVDTIKSILHEIKNHLYSNLKGSDIEDIYFEFLAKLKTQNVV